MNLLDAILVVAIGAAAYGGYRLGFITRALSWAGLATGVAIAIVFVDDLADALQDEPERSRLVAALALVFVLGTLGQVAGLAAGSALRNRLPARVSASRGDRIAGAVTGALGVVIGLWLLIPALTSAPGWTAQAARDSEIVRFVDRVAPAPPAAARDLARRVADAQFPDVFDDPFRGPEDVGPAPTGGLAPEVSARVEMSVVKVEGPACDQIQSGSGFVAGEDLVVTNAHVVAGERDTEVETDDGRRLDATVVAFDPDRDLALLDVPGLDLFPLERATAGEGDTGAVYGHPGGGDLRAAPARIAEVVTARGTDIYRADRIDRSVFVLAAGLAPGDSGGPLVDQRGRVVGVAFAVDPGNAGTAYALTRKELDPVLASAAPNPVDTGPCVVG
ncbi:MAG TPA: MarP family serine protease [Acidimicrobiia bacterium]|nr:MarP family serine protease [Acidimicrobiia bacterium]